MTRVHDMGGRFGDGPVEAGEQEAGEEPVFKQDWHARALAVTLAAGALGQWNLDVSRHARERLSPKDYTRFHYYEKWLAGLADLLVETGVVTREELAAGRGTGTSPLAPRSMTAEAVAPALARGGPADREVDAAPRFAVGDAVRARRPARNVMVEGGHTRLPAYAAGAVGRIAACHGAHVLPDANAHGLGERPEPLYSVVFDAAELWGRAEGAGDEVRLDLWQSYLEAA